MIAYHYKSVKNFNKSVKVRDHMLYAIDFGVTNDGKTVFVEINVSGSIGSYGLEPISYAKFMAARWAELTATEDECSFDI